MNPTLLYNGYFLERRKFFENNPRSNFYSSIDFTWPQSINKNILTPKQIIQRKKQQEKEFIRKRSNQLIKERLKKEINLEDKYDGSLKKYETINLGDMNRRYEVDDNKNERNRSKQINIMKYSLRSRSNCHTNNQYNRQQILNQQLNQFNTKNNKNQLNNEKYSQRSNLSSSRMSLASSQLNQLIPKQNYLGDFLTRRLDKYINNNNGNINDKNINSSLKVSI